MTFGIDLGTTHSCIAHIDETGRPAVIKSALGDDTTPSAVYFESPQSVVVGRAAKNAARLEPDKVAQLVKRDMGTDAEYTYLGVSGTPRRRSPRSSCGNWPGPRPSTPASRSATW